MYVVGAGGAEAHRLVRVDLGTAPDDKAVESVVHEPGWHMSGK